MRGFRVKIDACNDSVLSRIHGEVYESEAACLRDVRNLANVTISRYGGVIYVYSDRADARRDREGAAPHLCRASIARTHRQD